MCVSACVMLTDTHTHWGKVKDEECQAWHAALQVKLCSFVTFGLANLICFFKWQTAERQSRSAASNFYISILHLRSALFFLPLFHQTEKLLILYRHTLMPYLKLLIVCNIEWLHLKELQLQIENKYFLISYSTFNTIYLQIAYVWYHILIHSLFKFW